MSELEGNAVASAKAIWLKYRYHHPGWAMVHAGLLLVTAGVWSLYFVFNWWAFYTGMETLPGDDSTACPVCGDPVDETMEYCPSCGADVANLPPEEAPACTACGEDVEASMAFCPSCGIDLGV